MQRHLLSRRYERVMRSRRSHSILYHRSTIRFCLMGCAFLKNFGCANAIYPETIDASSFDEFEYRVQLDPPCLDSPSAYPELGISYGPVCEAQITRDEDGVYMVRLGVRTDFQQDSSPYLPTRKMNESEMNAMLTLFADLSINRHPQPFCYHPALRGLNSGAEVILRWDETELVINDCDRARIDFRDGRQIGNFLDSLVPMEAEQSP